MATTAYGELRGAEGRESRFRAPRYDAHRLFPRTPPKVRLRSGLHQLRNISMGGLALACNNAATEIPDVGELLDVSLQQSGLTIFESAARVCRREDSVFGATVALQFVDTFLEVSKLLSRNTQAQIAANSQNAAPATSLVSPEYRLFCADVLSVLRTYRDILSDTRIVAGESDCVFDPDSCYDACEARLLQQWRGLWYTGNDLVRGILNDRDVLQATKEFTERVLTPDLCLGPIWNRAYFKPLGYPGDFEVMNYLYSWKRAGADTYGALMHRLGLECAECVVTRMNMVQQKIAETVAVRRTRPARILSLGCGPAREVELYLSGRPELTGSVDFLLVDQEKKALLQANERAYPHLLRSGGRAQLQCLNISFTEILRSGSDLDKVAPQDLIYSVGLLDYLNDRRAAALTRRLYNSLAPGGLLIIGNMNDTAMNTLWPMELVADWSLHYRGEAQMLSWARGLQPNMAWTEVEATGHVRLLFIHKPSQPA
ncbi:MAG TPA: PilZ domain-containing protein [Rhizomicrobium sp.]|nr:PilZ domain-containing protein [Rhizomicrobium sp.]